MTRPAHRIVTSPDLAQPRGYAHAVAAANGQVVFLSGQVAQGQDGGIRGVTLLEQFDQAATNVVAALRAAGGSPADLVSLQVFVTDVDEYRAIRTPLREVWMKHFGDHYPAMAVLGIRELVDPAAKIELMGIAVVA